MVSQALWNKMLAVKLDHLVTATAPGHDGNVVHIIVRRHRGDGRRGILRGEFQLGVQLPQPNHFSFSQRMLIVNLLGVGRRSYSRNLTFHP